MKKKIIISILVIIFGIIILGIIHSENFRATERAVVMKVNKNSLSVMDLNGSLYSVSFADEGNIGFKEGQEVLIYFDGMIAESYPAQIYNVGKIKIVKEKSDVSIPENVLRYYYCSRDNVKVSVSELTSKEISLTIKDTNEYQYGYSNDYTIYKKVKNKDYTGIGYKIGKDTENSISGYTRNRT